MLAYFRSEGCADDFQKAIDWIADEWERHNATLSHEEGGKEQL